MTPAIIRTLLILGSLVSLTVSFTVFIWLMNGHPGQPAFTRFELFLLSGISFLYLYGAAKFMDRHLKRLFSKSLSPIFSSRKVERIEKD